MKPEEDETEFRQVAEGLVYELALMHATLFTLIADLHSTELTSAQREFLEEALRELVKSQERFFSQYAGQIGGMAPENN